MLVPTGALIAVGLALTVFAGPIFSYSERAAAEVLDRGQYISAVLGHSMRRPLLRAWVLCWLTLVWMLLWGNVSAANVLSGLAVALVIIVLLPLPPVPIEGRLHPMSLLRLVVQVGYYLVLSSVQVAWLAIKPGPPPTTAVLRAHLALKSDLVLALAVNVINLIPGIDRAGDRPDPPDDLRPRHRRRFRALGERSSTARSPRWSG